MDFDRSVAGVLVGRDAELSVLCAVLDAARSGRPTVALVVGEAGMGKTRLADEAAVVARATGMHVLRGEADASRREPMGLWRGVYRALQVEPVRDPALPTEERQWEHLETLSEALVARAPALVLLEDLHWADPIAIWVLDHLPRQLCDAPVAIIATSRDDEPDMPPLDGLRRVARVLALDGLDVEAVRALAAAAATGSVDAPTLLARTGGNPLFVQELARSPDLGATDGVVGSILERSLERFDDETRELLATAGTAGPETPLAVLATAASCTTAEAGERLETAQRAGVLGEVAAAGARFHHALLAEAAARLSGRRDRHERLAAAWETVAGLDARAAVARHRLRAADTASVARAVETACDVATELVAAGRPERAAGLLRDASEVAVECGDRPELRARVALDLAKVLRALGDLEPALVHYRDAARLAREGTDPVMLARAELGANLWATAFIPDPARMRRLEQALAAVPHEEVELRAMVLGRLTVVGGADPDAADRVRVWAADAVTLARATGDPVLTAQALINQTMSPPTRSELDARIAAADEVVALAEHAGRSDLALHGHQRRVSHHLNHGDLAAANQSLGRAELLAELLPSPGWRQRTLVQRTTLLALSGNRAAAIAAMHEAAHVGSGHIEPIMLLGSEALHQIMLIELYGTPGPRGEEVYRAAAEMVGGIGSPTLQLPKALAAHLFGDDATVHEVLHRYAHQPEKLTRSMTGDHLLRVLGELVIRTDETQFAEPVYRTLLPYTGLLNVGGGQSVGLPVDDVLGRLAALAGDVAAAVGHARDAVETARAIPSPPMLVHCLDHLADALARADGDDASAARAEADALATTAGVVRPDHTSAPRTVESQGPPARMWHHAGRWTITSPLGDATLADRNGLGQLARLLRTPGVEVSALELAGQTTTEVAAGLGPALDGQAKRAYRQRLLELQAEVDDADAANDPVRGERAHVEMDALVRELKRAVGLGGRDRPTGSDAERARVNVARSIKRALTAIGEQAPLLGAHLEESVRTGGHCIFLQDPSTALSWTVVEAAATG